MSYLLTEIALEMLGYKFYDIDGNYGPTNFQQVNAEQESRRDELSCESLQKIIGFCTDAEEVQIGVSNKSIEDHTAVKNDIVTSDETEQTHSYSAGLKRLLDLEYKRLRNQFEQVLNEKSEQLIDMNAEENNINDDILKVFLLKEKEKIEREAHTLQTFRKLVEKSTNMINKDVFNQYKRVFGGSYKG